MKNARNHLHNWRGLKCKEWKIQGMENARKYGWQLPSFIIRQTTELGHRPIKNLADNLIIIYNSLELDNNIIN